MRRPFSERWSREELQALRVVPWVWRAADAPGEEEPQVIPHAEPAQEELPPEGPADESSTVWRVRITNAHLEQYGYTAGCRRCTLLRTGRGAHGVRHSEACRARLEGLLRAAHDPSMVRADAKLDEHLAAQVQARVEAAPTEPRPPVGVVPTVSGSSSSGGPAAAPMGQPLCTVSAICPWARSA